MKKLLLSTALVAVSGAAFADNYKIQLDNLDNAFQCQNHFERGEEIAGSIDEFEFCVWYLNSNRKGFIRNDMFYDILPSGDVIAVKKNLLSSKDKAQKAIEAAIKIIIEEKEKIVYEDRIEYIVVESGEVIDQLTADLIAAGSQAEIDAAEIARIGKELASLKIAKEAVEAMLASIDDGITQADVEAVRNELTTLLNAKTKMFNDETAKVATLTYKLGSIQAAINSAYDTSGVVYENLAAKVDDLAAERNALKQQIADIKADLASHDIVLSETAINEVYNAGKAEIQKVLDEEKAAHVKTFEALTAANVAIDQHMTDLSRFENMTKELNATITSLNSDLAAKTAKITNQETKIGNLEGELKAEKATVANLNGQIERLKEEIGTHTGNIETLKEEIEDLEGELDTANGNVTRLEGELSTAQGDADFYLKEATKLGQEVYQLTSELAAANKLAADRLEIIKELNGTIHTLQTETVPNAHADGVTAGKAAADQAVVDFNLQVTAEKVPGETWSSNPQTVAELLETTEALDGRVRLFQDHANSLQEIINGHSDDRDMANATGRRAILDQIAAEIVEAGGTANGIPSVDQILEDRASSTGADYHALVAGWLDTLPAENSTYTLEIRGRLGVMGQNIHNYGDLLVSENSWTSINVQPVVDAYIATLDLSDEGITVPDHGKADVGYLSVEGVGSASMLGSNEYIRVKLGPDAYDADSKFDTWINLDRLETYQMNSNIDGIIEEITNTAKRAYAAGYNDGYDDGYNDGYKDGFRDGVNSLKSS